MTPRSWYEHARAAIRREQHPTPGESWVAGYAQGYQEGVYSERINVSGFRVPSDEAPMPTYEELVTKTDPSSFSWPCTELTNCHEHSLDCRHHRG